MAGIDSYAPCPCGSGQKFKWCCQKVEAYADRAQRLLQTGQTQAAIDALDEGLRREPANAWLLIRKALIQIREGKAEEAKATLRQLLQRQPQHVAAHALLIRAVLESEGPLAGIAELQHALTAVTEADRPGLASMIGITGSLLARLGHYPAALAHLALAASSRHGPTRPTRRRPSRSRSSATRRSSRGSRTTTGSRPPRRVSTPSGPASLTKRLPGPSRASGRRRPPRSSRCRRS